MLENRFSFRAWNKKEKKYIDDIQVCDDGYGVGEPCRMCFGDYLYECETYEVEQCTGLKDKYGNLIYEGDIVNVTQFYNGVPTTKKRAIKVLYKFGRFNVHDVSSCYLEIIGNIHENSKLLED